MSLDNKPKRQTLFDYFDTSCQFARVDKQRVEPDRLSGPTPVAQNLHSQPTRVRAHSHVHTVCFICSFISRASSIVHCVLLYYILSCLSLRQVTARLILPCPIPFPVSSCYLPTLYLGCIRSKFTTKQAIRRSDSIFLMLICWNPRSLVGICFVLWHLSDDSF